MLAEALHKYGYVLLFFGAGVEGDAALATGAFLAQQGRLDPVWTLLTAVAGSCLAGEASFRLGRRHGRPWIEKRAGNSPRLARMERWTSERSGLLTFLARFLWGFRLTIPALCGASGMSQRRFSLWNSIGAAFWGVLVGSGAYFFGRLLEKIYGDIEPYLPWAAGGLFAALFGLYLWRRHDRFVWRWPWRPRERPAVNDDPTRPAS